ncbi:MAG: helix-turn-helix transcriptional regulator [Alphaproteobacteria bacterium]|nr:helix-turn-helix transcriptional regulator [Alphaproteobacteria bacterium]
MSIDKINLSQEFVIPEGEQEVYDLIGKTIRDARVARDISQKDIADALDIDVDVIDAYENAEIAVPVYHFLEIAKFMKWPTEFDEMQKKIA